MHEIKASNQLNQQTIKDIYHVVDKCNQHDKTRGKVKIDDSINYYPEMKSLFLLYEDNQLVSFMKLFSVFPSTVEISGYTLPEFRGRGYFKILREKVIEESIKYNYKKITFVIDSASIEGLEWTRKKSLLYENTEVTMKLANYSKNLSGDLEGKLILCEFDSLDEMLSLNNQIFTMEADSAYKYLKKVIEYPNKELYFLKESGLNVGMGGIYYTNDTAVLFGIGILKEHRKKGYSKKIVSALIEKAKAHHYSDIELEVDQDNLTAYSLYKNIGFIETSSMCYFSESI
ncbi:MAG: GNAT family N-acetyltransferase [Clostridiales bacterium]|nr:GNAT family N-acetyltransferase [Clostridiales bacterium]